MIEYARRRHRLPPPPQIVWTDLAAPRRNGARVWLVLTEDERAPEVLARIEPHRVVWSSIWPGRPDDRIEFTLGASEGESVVEVVLLAAGSPPAEAEAGRLRYRISQLIGAQLRYSYGQ